MIRLRFGGLPAVRLATSPAWELLGYALTLRDGRHPAVPEGRVHEWRLELPSEEMTALAFALSHTGFVPDFLVPPPIEPFGSVAADMARVEAAPVSDVAHALDILRSHASGTGDGAAPTLDRWTGNPAEFRRDVTSQMARLWGRLVEPLWTAHRGVLEREVLTRGRELALDSAAHLLNGLHADVRFDGGTLHVDCGAVDLESDCGPELLLVPSVLVWPKTFVGAPDGAGRPTLYYPARGAATMFTGHERSSPVEGPDALDELLGVRRARILRHLARPATTSDLAAWMDVSASSVSQHLARLASVGLVCRTRVGRRVYYERTSRGDRLVELFTE